MDRYKRLASNTVLFAISTFSSKALVFLLLPLYTRVLSKSDFGAVDLIIQAANLLIPVVTVGVLNAVIRFGLDKKYDKKAVFTSASLTIGAGLLVFLAALPLMGKLDFAKGYSLLLYFYVLCGCARALCSQFVRARNITRLYALDGIFSTVLTIAFTVLYLVVLKLGITGYLLAIITADLCSALFLFFTANLWRFFSLKSLDGALTKQMFAFCLPLIPATMFWWITNVSNRYLINHFLGGEANGIYAIAYKVPMLIVLVSTIFTEAWQLSAIGEAESGDRSRFFSQIYGALSAAVLVAAAGLTLLAKFITSILVSPEFFESWQYMPMLVLATVFSTFVSFQASVYLVERRSAATLITMLCGAVANILLNLWFIPKWGIGGAAVATFISYLLVFVIRCAHTMRYIKINYRLLHVALSVAFIFAELFILKSGISFWFFYCALAVLAVILLNIEPLLETLLLILPGGKGRRGRALKTGAGGAYAGGADGEVGGSRGFNENGSHTGRAVDTDNRKFNENGGRTGGAYGAQRGSVQGAHDERYASSKYGAHGGDSSDENRGPKAEGIDIEL